MRADLIDKKCDVIFVISDQRKTNFATLFSVSSQINFSHFKFEIMIFWPKLQPIRKSYELFGISKHSYFDILFSFWWEVSFVSLGSEIQLLGTPSGSDEMSDGVSVWVIKNIPISIPSSSLVLDSSFGGCFPTDPDNPLSITILYWRKERLIYKGRNVL